MNSYVCVEISSMWLGLSIGSGMDLRIVLLPHGFIQLQYVEGTAVAQVLRYKSEGRWFDSRWCHGIFH
jgi:hypothetical protein